MSFYQKTQPDLEGIQTVTQMMAFFGQHPGWSQLPRDVLEELSKRISDKSRQWIVYDTATAFKILILMTEQSNAIRENFIPICNGSKRNAPEWNLYLFAMTFGQLASKYIREISENAESLPIVKISNGYESAKAFAESSLICDRYFISSFIPSAWGWVLKNGDSVKAISILDEGISWAKEMGVKNPHKESIAERSIIINPGDHIDCLEETKSEILKISTLYAQSGAIP